ncbi:amidohydrolase family protein [Conexibacter sp. CPCC 206217]|uniref:amidohydrolase family protein n=1 Tax=Conexibacter sp. CPCC 206217 TaxID=3064574 RepID=UPI00271C4EB4|nr:amidohydrolase family protein [Conexibacter sp. CPCC 206217]MDO8209597.1 amidohydrolase family protein [Conexibacter sp. CPCC 206217]
MSATLLRGARVITMTPGRPDVERLDVLVVGDRIVAVGEGLSAAGASRFDLAGRIVLPGLVNAHLHTWQTPLRSLGADWGLAEYLSRIHQGAAQRFTPDDIHVATLAGALNQIDCGTTTLGDWSNNLPTPAHTDAAVDAIARAEIRAVFLHGGPRRAAEVPHAVAEVDRLLDVARSHRLLTIGMAINGPQASTPEVAVNDFAAAAERGIIVSMHQSGDRPKPGWDAVRAAGLLGPRTNVVHGAGLTDDWVARLVEAGASFTATPENELSQGHGSPITGRLLRRGAAPSLGTDTEAVVGGAIMTAARIALAHQRNLDNEPTPRLAAPITSRQALTWATTEGAKALGLADRIGRIEPGMQADLIAVDARRLSLLPAHDAIATALRAAAGDIEAMMIAGRWRKRDHRILDVDLDALGQRLRTTGERVLEAAERRAR